MKVEALVLAAGAGSRFGGGKLVALYRGRPVLHGALEAALASPARRVILVTGHEAETTERSADDFIRRSASAPRLTRVRAADHRQGLGASVSAGAREIAGDVDAALLFLADMPRVPHSIAAALIGALGDAAAAAPECQGRRGHPVLFARRLLPALLTASGDQGARDALQGLGSALRLVPTEDDGVLFDVDRTEDLDQ